MSIWRSNSKKIRFLFFVSFLAPTLNVSVAFAYSGQADHRLVAIERLAERQGFDPNQDILKETDYEKRWAQFKKNIMRSTYESLIPLVSYIKNNQSSDNLNILQSVLASSSLSFVNLAQKAMEAFKANQTFLPFYSDIYLLPNIAQDRDLFYSDEKISINGIGLVNLLGSVNEKSQIFEKAVTNKIKELQIKYANSKDPFSLLAFRRSVIISKQNQRLRYDFLIQLQPREEPFVKPSEMVTIQKIVIPKADPIFRNVVAHVNIDLDFDITKKIQKMSIDFGCFEKYKGGLFFLNFDTGDKCTPALSGKPNKKIVKDIINIPFGFKKLNFNLNTQKLDSLDIYTRPGLIIGNHEPIDPFFFKSEYIDNEFKKEINKTIEAEITALMDKIFSAKVDRGTK